MVAEISNIFSNSVTDGNGCITDGIDVPVQCTRGKLYKGDHNMHYLGKNYINTFKIYRFNRLCFVPKRISVVLDVRRFQT